METGILAEFQISEGGVNEFFAVAGEVKLPSMTAMLPEEIVRLYAFGGLYGEQLRHPFFEVFHLAFVLGQDAGGK